MEEWNGWNGGGIHTDEVGIVEHTLLFENVRCVVIVSIPIDIGRGEDERGEKGESFIVRSRG